MGLGQCCRALPSWSRRLFQSDRQNWCHWESSHLLIELISYQLNFVVVCIACRCHRGAETRPIAPVLRTRSIAWHSQDSSRPRHVRFNKSSFGRTCPSNCVWTCETRQPLPRTKAQSAAQEKPAASTATHISVCNFSSNCLSMRRELTGTSPL